MALGAKHDELSSDPEPTLWKETTKFYSAHYPQAHTYEFDEILFFKKKEITNI